MEPYVADDKAGSSHNIITKMDPTCGRWPSASIHGLCKIVRRSVEPTYSKRVTIAEVHVCKLTQGMAVMWLTV